MCIDSYFTCNCSSFTLFYSASQRLLLLFFRKQKKKTSSQYLFLALLYKKRKMRHNKYILPSTFVTLYLVGIHIGLNFACVANLMDFSFKFVANVADLRCNLFRFNYNVEQITFVLLFSVCLVLKSNVLSNY